MIPAKVNLLDFFVVEEEDGIDMEGSSTDVLKDRSSIDWSIIIDWSMV